MTLSEQQCRFTFNLSRLIAQAVGLGYEIKILEVNRTVETQKEYVAKGVSWTMDSRHLDKLAADVMIYKNGLVVEDEAYRPLGVYWESLGGRWGGRFGLEKEPKAVQDAKIGKDQYHFEMRKEK